jgi:hypothetical protein
MVAAPSRTDLTNDPVTPMVALIVSELITGTIAGGVRAARVGGVAGRMRTTCVPSPVQLVIDD